MLLFATLRYVLCLTQDSQSKSVSHINFKERLKKRKCLAFIMAAMVIKKYFCVFRIVTSVPVRDSSVCSQDSQSESVSQISFKERLAKRKCLAFHHGCCGNPISFCMIIYPRRKNFVDQRLFDLLHTKNAMKC